MINADVNVKSWLIKVYVIRDIFGICILDIVFFSIFFTIDVAVATYFVFYKYVSRNKENVSKYDYIYQTTI